MHTFVVYFPSLSVLTSWSSWEWVGFWVSLHLSAWGSSMDLWKKDRNGGNAIPWLWFWWAESTAPVLCRHTSAVLMTEKASPLKQSLSSQHLNSLQMPRCSYCCTGTIPANPAYTGQIRPPVLPCPTGKLQTTSGTESHQQSHDFTDQPSPHSQCRVPGTTAVILHLEKQCKIL